MKDFRRRIIERRPNQAQIREDLQKGHLKKALRKARATGLAIPEQDIEAIVKEMFRSGRAGELLAMIGKVEIEIPYDVSTLLSRAFDVGDYHNFLKHVDRLGIANEHRERIREAIGSIKSKAPLEASAWERKFGLLCISSE